MRDMLSNQQLVIAAPQTLSGTTPNNSALFDTKGFDALTVYAVTGTVTDAGDAAGFSMKLQESDSTAAGTFTDVADDDLLGADLTATLDTQDNVLLGGQGYRGNKRYVRAVFTGTTGTNAVVQALAVLGKPHRAPVAATGSTTAAT